MKLVLLDSILSPDWLKYGFAGLVAIFAFLTYFIFRYVIEQDSKKKFWVLLFVVVNLILLSIGGLYMHTNDQYEKTNKLSYDSLTTISNNLRAKLETYTNTSPDGIALRQKIKENSILYDSLMKENNELVIKNETLKEANTALKSDNVKKDNEIQYVTCQHTVDGLQDDLHATSGDTKYDKSVPDMEYRRLRRAVFFNFVKFNADKEILKKSLYILRKQEESVNIQDINKLLKNYSQLMRIRYKWLKDEAIPSLFETRRMLSINPAAQTNVHSNILMPKEIWIIPNATHKVVVTDLASLTREKQMLERKLADN